MDEDAYDQYRAFYPIEYRLAPAKLALADALVESGVFPPEKATDLKEAFALADYKEFQRKQTEGREWHKLVESLPWRQRRQCYKHKWATWYIRERFLREPPPTIPR